MQYLQSVLLVLLSYLALTSAWTLDFNQEPGTRTLNIGSELLLECTQSWADGTQPLPNQVLRIGKTLAKKYIVMTSSSGSMAEDPFDNDGRYVAESVIDATQMMLRVTIKNVQPEDAGVLTCIGGADVDNSFDEKEFTLKVKSELQNIFWGAASSFTNESIGDVPKISLELTSASTIRPFVDAEVITSSEKTTPVLEFTRDDVLLKSFPLTTAGEVVEQLQSAPLERSRVKFRFTSDDSLSGADHMMVNFLILEKGVSAKLWYAQTIDVYSAYDTNTAEGQQRKEGKVQFDLTYPPERLDANCSLIQYTTVGEIFDITCIITSNPVLQRDQIEWQFGTTTIKVIDTNRDDEFIASTTPMVGQDWLTTCSLRIDRVGSKHLAQTFTLRGVTNEKVAQPLSFAIRIEDSGKQPTTSAASHILISSTLLVVLAALLSHFL